MAHDVEADEVVVEPQRVIDIRHMEVDVAHLRSIRHWRVEVIAWPEVAEELLHVDRVTT